MCCHDEPEAAKEKQNYGQIFRARGQGKVCVAHVTFVLASVLSPHCRQISERTCNGKLKKGFSVGWTTVSLV